MPRDWNWCKYDKKGIYALAKKTKTKINSFPSIGTYQKIYFEFYKGIKFIPFLDYFNYNKDFALKILQEDYEFKPYPYKHYESIFTRFYQGYILPKKFKVDKRRIHLSNLIITGQKERGEVLEILKISPYPSEKDLKEDKEYFLKKMLWSENDLVNYINRPVKSHYDYPTERYRFDFLSKLNKKIKSNLKIK